MQCDASKIETGHPLKTGWECFHFVIVARLLGRDILHCNPFKQAY